MLYVNRKTGVNRIYYMYTTYIIRCFGCINAQAYYGVNIPLKRIKRKYLLYAICLGSLLWGSLITVLGLLAYEISGHAGYGVWFDTLPLFVVVCMFLPFIVAIVCVLLLLPQVLRWVWRQIKYTPEDPK